MDVNGPLDASGPFERTATATMKSRTYFTLYTSYILVNYNDLTATLLGIMVSKGESSPNGLDSG